MFLIHFKKGREAVTERRLNSYGKKKKNKSLSPVRKWVVVEASVLLSLR